MISRYMVLVASEQKLLMMRPYQIYAVKHIVDCIDQNCGNGYIWHTTGSGKTLTSFKASTLLKDNPDIDKCLFVVDRKDLDRQTREEFNRFQEGCVEENTNTGALVRRLLSDDYADKVIVTTIQKLGLALDENSKRNKQREKNGQATYKEQLEPLRDKRIVFIFDECHRSQFGENHKAIKEFFPKAQLFGFTGTPIFEENASYQQIEGDAGLLQNHRRTSSRSSCTPTPSPTPSKTATSCASTSTTTSPKARTRPSRARRSPSAPSSKPSSPSTTPPPAGAVQRPPRHRLHQRRHRIPRACSRPMQAEKQAADPDFEPLNIACVFSPPAEGNPDVQQIQEDLPQEKADNEQDPEKKKAALKAIIADYNARYGTNHSISEFDLYYQDVQKRIKDQQFPNADLPHAQKIDITIVVDMLLTGFDSKYLNTLYVDKNLKHHGLIQAFSRTNRVLNDTKPYGNILDFRQQQDAVDAAIALFSGEKTGTGPQEIWLVDKAPVVIEKLEAAVQKLDELHEVPGPRLRARSRGQPQGRRRPRRLHQALQGSAAAQDPARPIHRPHRARTKPAIEQVLPEDDLRGFRGAVSGNRPAPQSAAGQGRRQDRRRTVDQLDFEFVLFASAIIDYDYIMGLIARFSEQDAGQAEDEPRAAHRPDPVRRQVHGRARRHRRLHRHAQGRRGPRRKSHPRRLRAASRPRRTPPNSPPSPHKHGLATAALQAFVDGILRPHDLRRRTAQRPAGPAGLGWKARTKAELALMDDLIPLLHKRAQGRDISGLSAYEQ